MRIFFTEEAEKRLKDIFEYYNLNANKRVALRIVNEIVSEIDILLTTPNIGAKEPLLENRKSAYYYLVIKNYKVIYRIETDLIIISTIFDTRQNPGKIRKRVR